MNYYNEFDSKSADWLRSLISERLIPAGHVDTRSIVDVQPNDLEGYTQCHFFAGIAGWPLALKLAGWPEAKGVWSASCPCQPLSCAGLGEGHADERHLWPALYRLVAERRPSVVVGEQVASKDGREWFAGIRADLEGVGYAIGGADLCSAGVGAPNIRQRLYWVAVAEHAERRTECESRANGRDRQDGGREETHGEPGTCGEVLGLAFSEGQQHNGSIGDGNAGRRRGLANGSSVERLANTDGDGRPTSGPSGPERGECNPEHSSGAMRMGSPIRTRLEGHAGNGDAGDEPGRLDSGAAGPITAAGDAGGVDNATSERATIPGTTKQGSNGQDNGIYREAVKNFWSGAIWHPCSDGKLRRIPVEPAFFPLAARIPGRVAMLKGFGNAINPEVAAEFIRAVMECQP